MPHINKIFLQEAFTFFLVMEKKDLRHLSRSELVDLIYELKKSDLSVDGPTFSEVNNEKKRLRTRRMYESALFKTVGVLLVVAAISVLLTTLWMPVLQIYGSSMSPTLEPGDLVLSVKNEKLETGDVVAFYQGNKLLIKRVIATSGQWVDVGNDGGVTVDGKVLDEPYIKELSLGNCDIELPHQVKEAHYFIMGDNRDTSLDSRASVIGDISEEQIEGKVVFRIWPLNKFGSVQK